MMFPRPGGLRTLIVCLAGYLPLLAQQPPPANSNGMVWVNTDSGVYHKPGTRWYGKPKKGKYMSEADAQKAGFRAAERE